VGHHSKNPSYQYPPIFRIRAMIVALILLSNLPLA
jgi:hypothetical protein